MQEKKKFLSKKKSVCIFFFSISLCEIMRLNYMRSDENVDELLWLWVGWPWY